MSDHWHYSSDIHGGAEEHHRHYDLERAIESARDRIRDLEQTIATYGETLDDLRNRVYVLEHSTPEARQLQYEADVAMADLRASGYAEDY